MEINEKLDENIRHGMQLAGKSLQGVMLQEIDDGIQKTVPRTWRNVGREKRQMMSCMGTIQYVRRVYQDDKGQRRTPLDEVIGLEKYSRYSLSVTEKGSYLASELAFREASDMLGWLIGDYIRHSAIGRMVKKVGESYRAEEEIKLKQPFEEAEDTKPGHIPAKVLYGENDGVWISLQREEKQETEVRVGILYTGKRAINGYAIVLICWLSPRSLFWAAIICTGKLDGPLASQVKQKTGSLKYARKVWMLYCQKCFKQCPKQAPNGGKDASIHSIPGQQSGGIVGSVLSFSSQDQGR